MNDLDSDGGTADGSLAGAIAPTPDHSGRYSA